MRYIEHLKGVPADVLMVSACDKLHNLRSILRDLKLSFAKRNRSETQKFLKYHREHVLR